MMADIPPTWAFARMRELTAEQERYANAREVAFARYIASKEESPVDPLLLIAREMAAADSLTAKQAVTADNGVIYGSPECGPIIMEGRADKSIAVQGRLRALRRGMELAKVSA